MIIHIYGLYDENDNIRYVGQTIKNVELRLSEHTYYSDVGKTHKDYWIRTMLIRGLIPKIKELTIVEGTKKDGNIHETFYIKVYRALGANLTNLTDGGDGGCTPETARKIVEIKRLKGTDRNTGTSEGARKGFKTKQTKGNDRGWTRSKEATNKAIETKRKNGTLRNTGSSEGSRKAWETLRKSGRDKLTTAKALHVRRTNKEIKKYNESLHFYQIGD